METVHHSPLRAPLKPISICKARLYSVFLSFLAKNQAKSERMMMLALGLYNKAQAARIESNRHATTLTHFNGKHWSAMQTQRDEKNQCLTRGSVLNARASRRHIFKDRRQSYQRLYVVQQFVKRTALQIEPNRIARNNP